MSLITRCTACGTLFKVVADQLKISNGWVRCGQCSEVFDAQSNIVTAQVVVSPPVVVPPPSVPVTPVPAAQAQAQTQPHGQAPAQEQSFTPGQLPSEFSISRGADEGPTSVNWSPSEIASAMQADSVRPSLAAEAAFEPAFEPSDPSLPGGFTASRLDALPVVTAQTQASDALESMPTPGFVRQAQNAQRWRSPWMRLSLSVLALLLLALLLGQYAYRERDELAAREPALKPALQQLCEWLACQVEPPKVIDAIVVDSSSFNALPGQTATSAYYKLGVNLKNTSAMAVALPHVELSLRDGQDQVMASRVFSAAELGAQMPALQPSADMAGSVTVQIDTKQLQGQRISGYRVYAFYP